MTGQVIIDSNKASKVSANTWKIAFLFCFLALLVDGMDIALLGYTLVSLKTDLGITSLQAGALGSWSLAGMAVGGFLGGWACDKYGRVKVIAFSVISFSLLSGLIGLTHSFEAFAFFRFLSSIGLGAVYTAANTLMAESVPSKHRAFILSIMVAGISVGLLCAAWLAGWIIPTYGWRVLYFITMLPVIFGVLMLFMVPEPEVWKEMKRRIQQENIKSHKKSENLFKVILNDPQNRKMFLLWMFCTSFLQFGLYGMMNWFPAFLEQHLHVNFKAMTGYMIASAAVAILAKFISGYFADKVGRKPIFAIGTIGCAAILFYIVNYSTADNILMLMMVHGFFYGIPVGIAATYMTESFPTQVRGTAVGGSYNLARIAAIFAPLTIGFLSQHSVDGLGHGMMLMGLAWAVSGLIAIFFIKDRLYDTKAVS